MKIGVRRMSRIAFRVQYDGTDYHGWQAQPTGEKTIQGTIEQVLADFFKKELKIQGASRTDAGVHALDQVFAFDLDHPITLHGLLKVLNHQLPPEIKVFDPQYVPADFQPRFESNGKYYVYRIYPSKTIHPIIHRFVWQFPHQTDWQLICEAGDQLIGQQNFKSFAASNAFYQSYVRELFHFSCQKTSFLSQEVWELRFGGDGFMKQMIRNIVGTLMEIGRHHWPVSRMQEIIQAQDRTKAGPTAPAQGLMLEKSLILMKDILT